MSRLFAGHVTRAGTVPSRSCPESSGWQVLAPDMA